MNETQPARTRSWRRYVQFQLRTLLSLPVLVALGGYWYVTHRHAEAAREDLRRTRAHVDSGQALAVEWCEASLRLRQAEEAVPFTRAASARARHFARMVHIERWYRAMLETAVRGDTGEGELARIVEFRREALEALDPP